MQLLPGSGCWKRALGKEPMINSSREYKPWLDLVMEVQPRARIRAAYGERAHSGSILDSACRA